MSRLRLPRPRPLAVAAMAVVALALGGGWLWLRDSSLVAVTRVDVVGLGSGSPDAAHIRAALRVAAREMTTLDVRLGALRTAVAPFPVVKDLAVSTKFPHGLRIRVIEQVPVAVVTAGSRRVVVAGDGTLLRDVPPSSSLPTVSVGAVPGGSRLADPSTLGIVAVLAAAPYELLEHVDSAADTATHGVVVLLRNGPNVYFGDPSELGAKWTAATDVLADPGSAGASYIDVTDPHRPAAGT